MIKVDKLEWNSYCTLCGETEDIVNIQFAYDKSVTGGVSIGLCSKCIPRLEEATKKAKNKEYGAML